MDDHGREQQSPPPLGGFERSEKTPNGGGRPAGRDQQVEKPDPEVSEKPTRRRYSAEYKLKILRLVDKCTMRGELGSLLRHEGLYASHLKTWQKQREKGTLQGLTPKKRGRKAIPKNPLSGELQQLRRENAKLKHKLQQAETIIDVQKNFAISWELPRARWTWPRTKNECCQRISSIYRDVKSMLGIGGSACVVLSVE